MAAEAIIVIEFGEGVDSTALAVIELDDAVNIGADGKPKSQFAPGEAAGFVVHYDPAALRIDRVASSSGMVVDRGEVVRDRSTMVQLVSDPVTLPHIPAGGVSIAWMGNAPAIDQDGRRLSSADTARLPAIGTASYRINCHAYRLEPPVMSLADGEQWQVLVVVYMEAAA
jgi:hypothetical protein